MTRRILLPLAADTTETECGACAMLARKSPGMGYAPIMRCVLFRADRTADISAFAYDERLPRPAECLSAEREAVELQERAERAERERGILDHEAQMLRESAVKAWRAAGESRAERDARPEITPEDAASALEASGQFADPDNVMDEWAPLLDALRAHAGKVKP